MRGKQNLCNVAGCSLMVHEVKNVERIEQQGQHVVADSEDLVLSCIQQDPGQTQCQGLNQWIQIRSDLYKNCHMDPDP